MLNGNGCTDPGPVALRILFSGYAHVHFACFQPLYERLIRIPGVQVYVSGGLRSSTESGYRYDQAAMYSPFNLPLDRILTVEQITDESFDVLFSAHTQLILPRRVEKRIQIFHGVSFRNRAVRLENLNNDHYFLAGPYMRRRFIEAGLFSHDDKRALSIGFMKTDRLINGELDRSRLLKEFGFDGGRPILVYAPTGGVANSLESMGEDVIRQLSASGEYDLLIKLHDHPKNASINWVERLAPLEDEHCRVVRGPDVIPLLYLADLLISDASSVSSEFCLVDRPIIFLDVPELIENAGRAEHSMLDLNTWGRKTGLVVDRPENIQTAVALSLRHPHERASIRQAAATDLFYNPGKATDSAMAWLQRNILDGRAIHQRAMPVTKTDPGIAFRAQEGRHLEPGQSN
jgi:hypothetical protein